MNNTNKLLEFFALALIAAVVIIYIVAYVYWLVGFLVFSYNLVIAE